MWNPHGCFFRQFSSEQLGQFSVENWGIGELDHRVLVRLNSGLLPPQRLWRSDLGITCRVDRHESNRPAGFSGRRR
jgi:hypothetical protein